MFPGLVFFGISLPGTDSRGLFEGTGLFSGPRAFFFLLSLDSPSGANIFAKPVPGAQAQIQDDFVGKAATLWPDSEHVPGGSKGLGGWGLGNR